MDSWQLGLIPLGHVYGQDLEPTNKPPKNGNLSLKRIFLSFFFSFIFFFAPSFLQILGQGRGKNLAFLLTLFVLSLFWGLNYKIKF